MQGRSLEIRQGEMQQQQAACRRCLLWEFVAEKRTRWGQAVINSPKELQLDIRRKMWWGTQASSRISNRRFQPEWCYLGIINWNESDQEKDGLKCVCEHEVHNDFLFVYSFCQLLSRWMCLALCIVYWIWNAISSFQCNAEKQISKFKSGSNCRVWQLHEVGNILLKMDSKHIVWLEHCLVQVSKHVHGVLSILQPSALFRAISYSDLHYFFSNCCLRLVSLTKGNVSPPAELYFRCPKYCLIYTKVLVEPVVTEDKPQLHKTCTGEACCLILFAEDHEADGLCSCPEAALVWISELLCLLSTSLLLLAQTNDVNKL